MLVDEITLSLKAGRGGDGVVRWRHEKGKEWAGAAGGNGGRGGDVYAVCVRDIHALSHFRNKKELNAGDGGSGFKDSMHGANGTDLLVNLPIGTVVRNLENKKEYQLTVEGEKVLLLKGGRGGLGNEHFKGSKNTSPKESTSGKSGEQGTFYIELEIVADAGLIGLPNAGKSSLLNALTRAEAKVGAYPFTTLDPNLGELFGYLLADIPGIIEGASDGKGLGYKFLRHIKRTRMLLHLVSLENENVVEAYRAVRSELEKYGDGLSEKREIILLSKTDTVLPEIVEKSKKLLMKHNPRVLSISVYDNVSLKAFQDELIKELRRK